MAKGGGIAAYQTGQPAPGVADVFRVHRILYTPRGAGQSAHGKGCAKQRRRSDDIRDGAQFPQPDSGKPGQSAAQRGNQYRHRAAPSQGRRLTLRARPDALQPRDQLADPYHGMRRVGQFPQRQVQRRRQQQRGGVKIPLSGPQPPFHSAHSCLPYHPASPDHPV